MCHAQQTVCPIPHVPACDTYLLPIVDRLSSIVCGWVCRRQKGHFSERTILQLSRARLPLPLPLLRQRMSQEPPIPSLLQVGPGKTALHLVVFGVIPVVPGDDALHEARPVGADDQNCQ